MSELRPVELTEDRIPMDGIDATVDELVELYGGEINETRENGRRFTLPLRRGVATAGAVECTISWTRDDEREGTVRLVCDRDIDAPNWQRIADVHDLAVLCERARVGNARVGRRRDRAGGVLPDPAQNQRRPGERFSRPPGTPSASGVAASRRFAPATRRRRKDQLHYSTPSRVTRPATPIESKLSSRTSRKRSPAFASSTGTSSDSSFAPVVNIRTACPHAIP